MAISDYQTSYQISPIILVGGVAGTGMLPIVNLLSPSAYGTGITSQSTSTVISDNFGQFRPLPGHTLMENEVAMYPFANMTTAANAPITQPLHVSLEMIAPADATMTVSLKKSIFTALKATLDNHTAKGGYYNVATPNYIYQGCILTSLVDATEDDGSAQVQTRWIWNFVQPLLTEAQAAVAQNQAMARITNQTVNAGDPPGSSTITNNISNPSSNIVQNVVPSASTPVGSNVSLNTATTTQGSPSSAAPISPTVSLW